MTARPAAVGSRPCHARSRSFRTLRRRRARPRAGDAADRERLHRPGRARRHRRDLRDQDRPAQRRPRGRPRLERSRLSRRGCAPTRPRRSPSSATAAGRASIWSRWRTAPGVHNLVVCTLCSCYPWPVLGLPPVWYKSPPYRSRAVLDPRGVLAEFGVDAAGRARKSASGTRRRRRAISSSPSGRPGRGGLERGAARRPRHPRQHDRRPGSALRALAVNGAQDLGGMMGFGADRAGAERAAVPRRMGEAGARRDARRRRLRPVGIDEGRHRPREPAAGGISRQELLRDLDLRPGETRRRAWASRPAGTGEPAARDAAARRFRAS